MSINHEPRWLAHARTLIGTREIAGAGSNPVILDWAGSLGGKVVGIGYHDDALPWCGLFLAHCFAAADLAPPSIAVRASSWIGWGQALRPERLAPGAALVFRRPGGGHVGFYLGEDVASYVVLGGNQGDAVSIARLAKSRCVARRWPGGEPVIGRPQVMRTAGVAASGDEA